MEPGYYIPEPEEFHIGFEFERQQIVPEYDNQWRMKVKKLIFSKEYFTSNAIRYNFFEDLKEGKIRVKSLDESDILSLGFVSQGKFSKSFTRYRGDNINFEIIFNGEYIIPIKHDSPMSIAIKLKNKFELQKIIKQLGNDKSKDKK